jgi:hypothetical protein
MIGDERHQAGRVVRNEAAHERAFVMRHRTSMRQARDRFRGLRLFPRAALLPGGRDAVRAPCGGGHGHPLHGRDATRMQRRIVGRTHPFRRLVQSGERARVTRYMAGTSLPVGTPVCRQKKTSSPREELGARRAISADTGRVASFTDDASGGGGKTPIATSAARNGVT